MIELYLRNAGQTELEEAGKFFGTSAPTHQSNSQPSTSTKRNLNKERTSFFQTPNSPPPKKSEPFYIQTVSNYQEILENLFKHIGEQLLQKLTGELIRIIPKTLEQYELVKTFLSDNKVKCFGILPRTQRQKKILIRGLPRDTCSAEIQHALCGIGHRVIRVAQLKKPKTREPMPLFLVCLEPTPDFQSIYTLSELLNYEISVEHFKTYGAVQCYNCQCYFHSSARCTLEARCVKCAGPHSSRDCLVKTRDKIKCSNCNGNHTANFKGCPRYPGNTRKNKFQRRPDFVAPRAPSKPQHKHSPQNPVETDQGAPCPSPPIITPPNIAQLDATIARLEKIAALMEKIQSFSKHFNIPNIFDLLNSNEFNRLLNPTSDTIGSINSSSAVVNPTPFPPPGFGQ